MIARYEEPPPPPPPAGQSGTGATNGAGGDLLSLASAPAPAPTRRRGRGGGGSHCALCGRGVSQHNWPPRGGFLRRARAPWEGIQCDTCADGAAEPFLVCGECYNLGRVLDHHPTDHVRVLLSALLLVGLTYTPPGRSSYSSRSRKTTTWPSAECTMPCHGMACSHAMQCKSARFPPGLRRATPCHDNSRTMQCP